MEISQPIGSDGLWSAGRRAVRLAGAEVNFYYRDVGSVDDSMNSLLSAIVEDDGARVSELLGSDRSLAVQEGDEAKLYQAKIFHWLYAGDTALHLAAAGHRHEIARALLKAGADVN